MNIKSYLKGLGVGIIITSLVLIVSGNLKTDKMSDAEIIARAKELGLVESTTLTPSSLKKNNQPDEINESIDDDLSDNNIDKSNEDSQNPDDDKNNTIEENSADNELSNENNNDDSKELSVKDESISEDSDHENIQEMIVITIKSGEGSELVATKIREAGFTEDGASFNRFLCDNGYDKKLKVGNHEIPKGATFEEIAEILCSN